MITWKKQLGSHITDIGDLHLVLKERNDSWQLSIGIRAYSKDGAKDMIRPISNITQFAKPCDLEQAKQFTHTYMDKFITNILKDFS